MTKKEVKSLKTKEALVEKVREVQEEEAEMSIDDAEINDEMTDPKTWPVEELREYLEAVGLSAKEIKGLKTKETLLAKVQEMQAEEEGHDEDEMEDPANWPEDQLRKSLEEAGLSKKEVKALKTKDDLVAKARELMAEDQGGDDGAEGEEDDSSIDEEMADPSNWPEEMLRGYLEDSGVSKKEIKALKTKAALICKVQQMEKEAEEEEEVPLKEKNGQKGQKNSVDDRPVVKRKQEAPTQSKAKKGKHN